ncbi:MAG: acetyl-CoA carboxylase biotin carboxyl carrier protein [Treponema sp.]|uniref:acetyl-CoA carboxylase biotin carboxyl carrier protein n=1 Tax=Treponema sp. TaxID=166 RepID=UPI003FA3001B
MNEKFILNVFEKFEKSSAVLLHIKEGEAELTLKKEAAYQNVQTAVPFALQNAPIQPLAGTDANGYAVGGTGIQGFSANGSTVPGAGVPGYANAIGTGIPGGAAGLAGAGANSAETNPAATGLTNSAAVASAADANLVTVKSPIVGSFYRSPSPDAPAYVDKGSKVSKGQPLCILEAMKMMNTLECEYDGTIEEILAANGDLVEFDQPLFTIRV